MGICRLVSHVLIAALAAGAADAFAAADEEQRMIAQGRDIAEKNCARCHGIGARDEISPLREAPPFRRFRERYPIEHLAEAFAEGIVVGHGDMPAFEFQPPEIEALIGYLNSLPIRRSRRPN